MKKHYTIVGGTVVVAAVVTFLRLVSPVSDRGDQTSHIPPAILSGSSTNTPSGNTSSMQEQIAKRG